MAAAIDAEHPGQTNSHANVIGKPTPNDSQEVSCTKEIEICEDGVSKARRAQLRKNIVLAISFFAALCSGTTYGFSAYQLPLIERYAFTGSDTDLCFTLAFWATVTEPVGFIFAIWGSRPAVIFSGTSVILGVLAIVAMLQVLSTERWIGKLDVWLFAICFGLLAQGSSAMYTAALFSTIHYFEGAERQGTAIGLVSSGFGLSAAVWVNVFRLVFHGDLRRFFLVFGILYSAIILLYAWVVYVPPPRFTSKRSMEIDELGFVDSHIQDHQVGMQEPLDDVSDPYARNSSCRAMLRISKTLLSTPEVIMFLISFALLQGSTSGVLIGNVSLIARAMGASKQLAQTVVSFLSVANFAGRVCIGLLMDCWSQIPKPAFMFLTGLTLFATCVFLVLAGDAAPPWLACICILVPGLAYGANWAIMPAFMASEFGSHNSGIGFALASMTVAPVSAMFAVLTGNIYDAQAHAEAASAPIAVEPAAEPDENILLCDGAHCFHTAFVVVVCVSSASLLVSSALWCRRPKRRQGGAVRSVVLHDGDETGRANNAAVRSADAETPKCEPDGI